MVKRLPVLFAIIIIQTALAMMAGFFLLDKTRAGKIMPGVVCAGVPLGGLSPGAAEKKLESNFGSPGSDKLVLKVGGQQWEIPMQEIGAAYGCREAVQEAYAAGHAASLARRASAYLAHRNSARVIPLRLIFDREALNKHLERISREFSRQPQNARLLFSEGEKELVPARDGREIDLAETTANILKLQAGMEFQVDLAWNTVSPRVKDGDLAGLDDVLAKYLIFVGDYPLESLELKAALLDGELVKPGEVFSFKGVFSGAAEGAGLAGGKVGDWDRLATTLYGAALYAGLEIVERHHHTGPVDYAPVGLDASTGEGQRDLKFKNNLDRPVYLVASVWSEEGLLEVEIIGQRKDGIRYDLKTEVNTVSPETVVKNNSLLQPGESLLVSQGYQGYRVKVYRVWLTGGNSVKNEVISEDYYPPEPSIIEIGP